MDFSNKNTRKQADDGFFVPLVDSYTEEPIVDENNEPAGFMVRGVISPTVQEKLRDKSRENRKNVKEGQEAEDEDFLDMELIHQNSIDVAMAYIITAVNIEIGDVPVGSDQKMVREILNMTFPHFEVVVDENDERTLKIINKPFAKQITEAAEKSRDFMLKPKKS